MSEELAAPSRDELRGLLLRWQRGEITFYEVVDEAEAIEDRLWSHVDVVEFSLDDPRSLPTEIVSLLSMGYVAPLFVEDIPALLACLDAPPTDEASSLDRLATQLNALDDAERFRLARERYASQTAS
jgi:hypothetical protein